MANYQKTIFPSNNVDFLDISNNMLDILKKKIKKDSIGSYQIYPRRFFKLSL